MQINNDHTSFDIILLRYANGEASPEELEQVLAWLKESNDNIEYLHQFRKSHNVLSKAGKSFNIENAIQNFDMHLKNKKRSKSRKLAIFGSAAAVALLLIVLNITFTPNSNDVQIIAQSADALKEIVLSDGSTVTLNKNSTLLGKQFNSENRELSMMGEAFFEVAPDKNHPFTISIEDVQVQVLGTAFNIYTDSLKNIQVTVTRGQVAVIHNKERIELGADEQATFSLEKKMLSRTKVDIANSNSWKTGELVFKQTNLSEVVQSLNKNLSTNFVIANPELNTRKLDATFDNNEPIENVADILTIVLGVEIRNEEGKQVIYLWKDATE